MRYKGSAAMFLRPDEPPNGGPPASDPKSSDGGSGDDGKKAPEAVPYARFQEVIEQRNKAAKQLEELQEQAKKADEEKLRKNQEWETLAKNKGEELDTATSRVKALEEQLSQYRDAVKSVVDAELKDLPEEVKAMDPGEDDVLKRLAWVPKAKALAVKIAAAGKPGVPPKPNPSGGSGGSKDGKSAEADKPLVDHRRTF